MYLYFKCLTWDGVAIHVINQINEAKDGNRYPSLLHFSWCFIHCQSLTVKDNIILSWGHFFIWATAYYMTLHSSAALPSYSKWKLVCCCSARLCFGENYSHFIVPYKEDVYLPFVLSHSYTKKFEYWTIWIWHFSNLGPGSFAVSLKSLQVMLDLRRFIFEFKDFHQLFPLLQR